MATRQHGSPSEPLALEHAGPAVPRHSPFLGILLLISLIALGLAIVVLWGLSTS
jgi:hypothetical protein